MKIKNNYNLRSIAGEHLVIMNGEQGVDITRVISLSSSAAWLWEQLEGKDFIESDAVALLLDQYDVSQDVAEEDVAKWVSALRENNICE